MTKYALYSWFIGKGCAMSSCRTCQPFCDKCKPKFYTCPACGKQASMFFRKCTFCGRAMTPEDEKAGRAAWHEGRETLKPFGP